MYIKGTFCRKVGGKNNKPGNSRGRSNLPPGIGGHHRQLDDNLIGQLTSLIGNFNYVILI